MPPMNGLTVDMALDLLELQEGSSVTIDGVVSAVESYAVQLAEPDRFLAEDRSKDSTSSRTLVRASCHAATALPQRSAPSFLKV
jgi:hypothetical protein